MAKTLVTSIASTAAGIDPRAAILVFQEEVPETFDTNGSLLTAKIAASGPVQGVAVVVAFPRSKVCDQAKRLSDAGHHNEATALLADTRFTETRAFRRLLKSTQGQNGEMRILVRGLSSDLKRVIRSESHTEFLTRVKDAAPAVIQDAIVVGPSALDSTVMSLPQRLREVIGVKELTVTSALPVAQALAEHSFVAQGAEGPTGTNTFNVALERITELGYSSAMLPTSKLVDRGARVADIPLFVVDVPKIGAVSGAQSLEDQYAMSRQVFQALSTPEIEEASVKASIETAKAIEAEAFMQEFGPELGLSAPVSNDAGGPSF